MSTDKVTGRVTLLSASNVKRVRAIEITPGDDPMVIIGGGNEQGKSSSLDALEWALKGMGAVPQEPVRRGEEKAEIELHIGDFVVRRVIRADRKSSLKITRKGDSKGLPAPQSLLDVVDCPDPMAFAMLPQREMAEKLRQLSGVDFSELDRERAEVYAERTDLNRDADRLRNHAASLPTYGDAPDEPVDLAELVAQLDEVRAHNERNEDLRHEAEQAARTLKLAQQRHAELNIQLRQAEQAMKGAKAHARQAEAQLEGLEDRDEVPIRQQMQDAGELNRKVTANKAAGQALAHAESAERESQKLTQRLTAIDTEKARLLSESKLPVKGLEFSGDAVRFRGTPWEQLSKSRQIKVAVVIGLLQTPNIPVQVIRNGALLDSDSLAEIAGYAKLKGAQLFVERVGDGDEGAIIIEDGMVRS